MTFGTYVFFEYDESFYFSLESIFHRLFRIKFTIPACHISHILIILIVAKDIDLFDAK